LAIPLEASAQTKLLVAAQTDGGDAQLRAAERALIEGLSSSTNAALQPNGSDESKTRVAKAQTSTSAEAAIAKNAPTSQDPTVKTNGSQPVKVGVESPTAELPKEKENPTILALQRQLAESKKHNAELERQLEEKRGQLIMAETELSRMQSLLESESRARLGISGTTQASSPATSRRSVSEPRQPSPNTLNSSHGELAPSAGNEMQIATVSAEKADLRLGPGRNNSPLMTVARGSRLAVEARQGEWYRVFAPNGQRAWVHSSVVVFGNATPNAEQGATTRVRGFSNTLEDEAFQRIQGMTATGR
jgi:hypothetical protein